MGRIFQWIYPLLELKEKWSRKAGDIVGKAPEMMFRELSGRIVFLSDILCRKKGAVLWMTNLCSTCQEKIPLAEKINRLHGERVAVAAISVLGRDVETPQMIARRFNPTFILLTDPEDEIGRRLGYAHPNDACPLRNLLIVDSSRRIRFKHHLSAVSEDHLMRAIEEVSNDG
ncbi:MAG: redoxin domain-containing protein [Elusimicrobia bacterium]|nr:redoxin domain-containing protein [Elusimicrobiota bacterium]